MPTVNPGAVAPSSVDCVAEDIQGVLNLLDGARGARGTDPAFYILWAPLPASSRVFVIYPDLIRRIFSSFDCPWCCTGHGPPQSTCCARPQLRLVGFWSLDEQGGGADAGLRRPLRITDHAFAVECLVNARHHV